MKKIYLLAGVLGIALSSCLNNDDEGFQEEQERYVENIEQIQEYMTSNGLFMEEFPENSPEPAFYYAVSSFGHPDSVITPDFARVWVTYTGELLNGDIITDVDSLEVGYVYNAQGAVQDIQLLDVPDDVDGVAPGAVFEALTIFEIGLGGSIDMLLPARYAYQSGSGELQDGMASVPSYSAVRFIMEVLEINPTQSQ